MEFFLIVTLICLTITYPKLARYTIVIPFFGLTFGGFIWALAIFAGIASFSYMSFFPYFLCAAVFSFYLTCD